MKHQNTKGFTLIEALVAGGILGFIAFALLPAFSSLVNKAKIGAFRLACSSMVKAKMQEYVTGSGAIAASTTGKVPDGFQYAKYRYQTVDSAGGSASSCVAAPTSGAPGFRENSNGNSIPTSPTNATAPTEDAFAQNLLGFQLWVNLRGYDPRNLTDGMPTRSCPSKSGTDQYQFLRVGDAIEVTVTGMIRTTPTVANGGRGGIAFGGLSDATATTPNPQLSCSLTQIIYPPKQLYRYYLTADGRLINTQINEPLVSGITTGGNVSESSVTHFRNIWSLVPAGGTLSSATIGNIKSISVSPNNDRVYVLKQNEIWAYDGCTDGSVTVGAYTFYGIPDCSATPTKVFNVLPYTVNNITVDFGEDTSTDEDIIYAIRSGGPASTAALLKYTMPIPITDAPTYPSSAQFASTTDYTLLTNSRISSIFLVPSFPQSATRTIPALYFTNNECYQGPTGSDTTTPFCVSIFNAADTSFTMPHSDTLVQTIDFSN